LLKGIEASAHQEDSQRQGGTTELKLIEAKLNLVSDSVADANDSSML